MNEFLVSAQRTSSTVAQHPHRRNLPKLSRRGLGGTPEQPRGNIQQKTVKYVSDHNFLEAVFLYIVKLHFIKRLRGDYAGKRMGFPLFLLTFAASLQRTNF
jgi:hypothetical protein